MKRSISFGVRISIGFALVVLTAVGVTSIAILNMISARDKSEIISRELVPEVTLAAYIRKSTLTTMMENRGFVLTQDSIYAERGAENFAQLKGAVAEVRNLVAQARTLNTLKESLDEIENKVETYGNLNQESVRTVAAMQESRNRLDAAAKLFMDSCYTFLSSQNTKIDNDIDARAGGDRLKQRLRKITWVNDVIDLGNAVRLATWRAQVERNVSQIEAALPKFADIGNILDQMKAITTQEVDLVEIEEVRKGANDYRSALQDLIGQTNTLDRITEQSTITAGELLELVQAFSSRGEERARLSSLEASESLGSATMMTLFGAAGIVALGIAVGFFVNATVKSVVGPVKQVIATLSAGAEQVTSAAGQVAQSSQQMAEGASEQASSLEEVSSSLEEMASMTKQNADNARQANNLSEQARAAAEGGNSAMQRMIEAITRIKTSAEQTARIVKTIDEIAFQTNLLALNAAVEAARAGDAGKGFAVVAEEVRSLAQRSAEAAKNTAQLIEESQRNSEDGVNSSDEVARLLGQIVGAIVKVNHLVGEVTAASEEQAQGIDQVNTAVAQLDRVTQSNAASAEESSSASEELSAQARELDEMVRQLAGIIGAREALSGGHRLPVSNGRKRLSAHMAADVKSGHMTAAQGVRKMNGSRTAARAVTPETIIPLDEEDLSDF